MIFLLIINMTISSLKLGGAVSMSDSLSSLDVTIRPYRHPAFAATLGLPASDTVKS